MQLLIMAAGMGSRFGGLKQLAPLGPNDEFIIDYSVFDAIRAGFSKIVFIIKEENYDIFKETIGSRVEDKIEVEYVFQKLETVPSFVNIPEDRVKPWGTAHAIYCAKDAITEDFLVINADDFYGYDAFKVASDFIKNKKVNEYATIGYKVINTMTENGSVKRGVLNIKDGNLDSISESSISKEDGKIIASPLNGDEPFEITEDTLVSMNMLIFDTGIFKYLDEKIVEFFKNNENLEKCEFLIPDVMSDANNSYATVKVLKTDANWYGVTYKEDSENVKKALKALSETNEYPNKLW